MLIKYGYHVPNCRSGTVASCKKIDRSKLTAEQKNTYDELSGFIDSAIGLKQRFIRENFKKNSVIKNNSMQGFFKFFMDKNNIKQSQDRLWTDNIANANNDKVATEAAKSIFQDKYIHNSEKTV